MWHIRENGDPGPCTAALGKCPLGSSPHFETREQAQEASESELSLEYPVFRKFIRSDLEDVELELDFGSVRVTPGDLANPEVRRYFVNGLCGDLAREIRKIQGGDVYFLVDDAITDRELQASALAGTLGDHVSHVLLSSLNQPGKFLDAYGIQTEETVETYWDSRPRKVDSELLNHYRSSGAESNDYSSFAEAAVVMDSEGISYHYGE